MSTPMPRAGGWTAHAERSNLWWLRLMRWIAVTSGRTLARLVLHPIALYFWVANGRARRASAEYLRRVHGRPAAWHETYRHVHHFAATVLDRVYLLRGELAQFDIDGEGAHALLAPLARGEGILMVGAHLGSFEALRTSAQCRGARVAMLMYEDNARLINATLAAVAPQAQLHTIGLGRPGAMLAVRRWLDGGGLAGLLADRTLPAQSERSHSVWLDFLGQRARFSDGPFRVAAMLRRPVIFMAGLYHGGNRYELRFVELADFRGVAPGDRRDADARIAQALQRYVTLLEALCRESPYNWFNFFDFWGDDASVTAHHGKA